MHRHFYRATALILLVLAIGFQGQAVRADEYGAAGHHYRHHQVASACAWGTYNWIWGCQDYRLTLTGAALGLAATGEYAWLRHRHGTWLYQTQPRIPAVGAFAITTVGCAAAFPIVGTLLLNRPLTTREVYTGMADCVVPFVGGWMVEAAFHGQAWYEATNKAK